MGLTPPSTSRLVDNLIARGLMARNDHPADRRRVQLTVTDRWNGDFGSLYPRDSIISGGQTKRCGC